MITIFNSLNVFSASALSRCNNVLLIKKKQRHQITLNRMMTIWKYATDKQMYHKRCNKELSEHAPHKAFGKEFVACNVKLPTDKHNTRYAQQGKAIEA